MAILIPGAIAPPGAPVLTAGNLIPASEPIGAVRTLLDSLTGTYTDVDKAVIRHVYTLLDRAGTLAKLDNISFGLFNSADSLLNWKGGTAASRTGGTFVNGGFRLDGVDDYIDPGFNITGSGQYTQDDCSFGVYLKEAEILAGSTYYGVGRLSSNNPSSFIAPRSAANTVGVQINTSTIVTADYSGDLDGFWMAQRTSNANTYLYRNGTALINNAASASTGLPASGQRPVIGRTAGFYYSMTVTGWFSGDSLSFTQRQALQSAFELMTGHFAR
jgi:hypothetical protein